MSETPAHLAIPTPGRVVHCMLPAPMWGKPSTTGSLGPYPATVVRAEGAVLSLAVFVDSKAPIAYKGPVLGCEDVQPFDPKQPDLGGWLWPPR